MVTRLWLGFDIKSQSTSVMDDGKTHGVIKRKLFNQLDYIDDQLFEVEIVKSENQHKQPVIVGIFILRYAKWRMLELYFLTLLRRYKV